MPAPGTQGWRRWLAPGTPGWPRWRAWLLRLVAVAVLAGDAAAFTDSFHGLVAWFTLMGFPRPFSLIAPLMVDLVIVVSEVLLLLVVMEHWDGLARGAAIAGLGLGLAASVAANTGQHGWHQPAQRLVSYAVAPVALAGLVALGLIVLERHLRPPQPAPSGDLVLALARYREHALAGTVPPLKQVQDDLGCGQPRAQRIQAHLRASHPVLAQLNGKAAP